MTTDPLREAMNAMDAEPRPEFAEELLSQLLAELDGGAHLPDPENPMPVDLETPPSPTLIRSPRRRWVAPALAAAAVVAVLAGVTVLRDDDSATRITPVTTPDTTTPEGQVEPFPSGAVPAGTYRTERFQPPIMMTVPEGWERYFDLRAGVSVNPDPTNVRAPFITITTEFEALSVDAAYEQLLGSRSWTVSGNDTTTLAGAPARRFQATAAGGGTPIGVLGRGALNVDAGSVLEVTIGTIGGKTIVLASIAYPEDAAAWQPVARQVIASIQPAL